MILSYIDRYCPSLTPLQSLTAGLGCFTDMDRVLANEAEYCRKMPYYEFYSDYNTNLQIIPLNLNLDHVDHSKCLGVTIQTNLKWNQHVHNISLKANRILALIRRNLKLVSEEVKERAYLHLMEYASSVWCPWSKQDLTALEKVQRRAARFVKCDYSYTNSTLVPQN